MPASTGTCRAARLPLAHSLPPRSGRGRRLTAWRPGRSDRSGGARAARAGRAPRRPGSPGGRRARSRPPGSSFTAPATASSPSAARLRSRRTWRRPVTRALRVAAVGDDHDAVDVPERALALLVGIGPEGAGAVAAQTTPPPKVPSGASCPNGRGYPLDGGPGERSPGGLPLSNRRSRAAAPVTRSATAARRTATSVRAQTEATRQRSGPAPWSGRGRSAPGMGPSFSSWPRQARASTAASSARSCPSGPSTRPRGP